MLICTNVHIIVVSYEWDTRKSQINFAKHGIDFSEAVAALEDDLALTIRDPDASREERYVTLGMDARGRHLVVVFTWRQDRIRIISARRATRRERHRYEKK